MAPPQPDVHGVLHAHTQDKLYALDMGTGTVAHQLLWEEADVFRTVYEGDLGHPVGDVNYLLDRTSTTATAACQAEPEVGNLYICI